MTISTITPLPTAPSRDDAPATFISRANDFLAALVTMGTELNTSIGEMNTDIAGVNSDAAAAATSASEAAASATAAGNAAGASMWVSGQAYAEGDAAISGVDYQTYRAETATSGTTDPSADANWTKISGVLPSETGNAGKFLTTDGSTASWAAVSAGKVSRTATGAITAGDTVAINSDGTVSPVVGLEQAESVGSIAYFETANLASNWWSAAYDTTADKGIINFTYNSDGYLRSRVVTNTGGTLTFGTLSVTVNVAQTGTQCVYNADQDVFVITYHDTSAGVIKAVAAEIIGTILNYGTPVTIGAGTFRNNAIQTTDSAEVLVVYRDTSSNLAANTITCSGTTLTVNSQVSLSSVTIDTNQIGLAKNTSDGSFAAAFKDTSTSDPAVVKITVSGTTPTFGTSQKIASATMDAVNIIYNSYADRYIYVYYDQSSSPYTPVYKSLSESAGTFTIENTASPTYTTAQNGVKNELSYDPTNNVVMASQANSDGTDMIAYSIVLNNENFYFGASTSFAASSATNGRFVQYYDPDEQDFVVFYRSDTSSNYSGANAFDPAVSYSTRDRYFGIADSNIADAASGDITIVSGLNANVTGLNAGDFYYLSETGALTATSNGYPVGHALSATSILLDNVGVNAIPEQSGNSGKYLTTDGSNSSWGELVQDPSVGAIDAGGLVLTNTSGNSLISLSGASLTDNNPQGYAGIGRELGASSTDITAPLCAKYSTYYKRWFASGYGWSGSSSANEISIWSSVDGITWAIFTTFRRIYDASWTGNVTARNQYEPPFAIDESNGRIWIGGLGTTGSLKLAYFDPDGGDSDGTQVTATIPTASSGGQVCWMEFLQPANEMFIVAENGDSRPITAKVSSGSTTVTYIAKSPTTAFQSYEKWRFCYNYDESTGTYRVAMVVGDTRQIYYHQSTTPVGALSQINSTSGDSYDHNHQIAMNATHLIWTKNTVLYYKPFAGNSWITNTAYSTNTSAFQRQTYAINYNSTDGYTYAITQYGQVHKFTDPATTAYTSDCIGTTGYQVSANGYARIRFRST